MFSKELEDLINYSLLDGEIDKKEKKVIYKKAEEEGVDFDELEIYLNSKIYGQLSKDKILRDETSSSTQKKVRTKKSNSRKVNRHKKPKRRISFGVIDFVPAITSTILAIIVFFYYDNLFISILLSSLTFIFSYSILKFVFDGSKNIYKFFKYVLTFRWFGDIVNGIGNLLSWAFQSLLNIFSILVAIGILVGIIWLLFTYVF